MVWTTYKEKVKRLSQRIVDIQRPIRILDAIKWDASIEQELRKTQFKTIPKLGPDYYLKIELGFDPQSKISELKEFIEDVQKTLGKQDDLGQLLCSIGEQYMDVVNLLTSRGTRKFGEFSRKLYGSSKDRFFDDKNTITDLGQLLYSILSKMNTRVIEPRDVENIPAHQVVDTLNKKFKDYFQGEVVQAKLADGIVADASAGSEVVKIKEGSLFSARDVDILEVHEGWVHVGTTQNGSGQRIAKWLSKGPPRCAATQEGLAVMMEIFTFRSCPARARRLNDRILGVDKVEDGANLLELIEFYRTEGYTEDECLVNAQRVFRGGVLEGGAPFTKDISYCRGFIENYNFVRTAIRAGCAEILPFLFVGKIHVDDIPLLYQKYKEGVIDPPRYLPNLFKDLSGITVWMSFSSFLNEVDLKKVQERYDQLFAQYL